jgi:hypothetical protein
VLSSCSVNRQTTLVPLGGVHRRRDLQRSAVDVAAGELGLEYAPTSGKPVEPDVAAVVNDEDIAALAGIRWMTPER